MLDLPEILSKAPCMPLLESPLVATKTNQNNGGLNKLLHPDATASAHLCAHADSMNHCYQPDLLITTVLLATVVHTHS